VRSSRIHDTMNSRDAREIVRPTGVLTASSYIPRGASVLGWLTRTPTEGFNDASETCGRRVWLGPPLFAAVPETGHNARHGPRERACRMSDVQVSSMEGLQSCQLSVVSRVREDCLAARRSRVLCEC
jgi:hypothetical protein